MMLFPDRPLKGSIYQSDLGFETVESKKRMNYHLPEKLNKICNIQPVNKREGNPYSNVPPLT